MNNKRVFSACCIAYFVQAIVNIASPTMFSKYISEYDIPIGFLTSFILINFVTQLIVDLTSIRMHKHMTYKTMAILGNASSFFGIVFLGILPRVMNPIAGIIISTVISAFGSGLIEVVISPIVDSLPGDSKPTSMNFLHSFYCWGSMIVVAVVTCGVKFLGDFWWIVPIALSVFPLFNVVNFITIGTITDKNDEESVGGLKLLKNRTFRLFMLIMICAGASELVISQWSSLFVETGLGVLKFIGDLLGPCLFAALMGTGRVVIGYLQKKVKVTTVLMISAALAFSLYLVSSLVNNSIIALLACGAIGFFVACMWPSSLSLGAETIPEGGAALFSLLAFAGDIGCSLGPTFSGVISDLAENNSWGLRIADALRYSEESYGLRIGILFSSVFPLILLVVAFILSKKLKDKKG